MPLTFNNSNLLPARGRCIHELFEEQVRLAPDSVALVFAGQQLTYGQLNERANQLAHYLRQHGVGAESLVGICVERSLEMIVGLLGILKAGGAYVPLDPAYPSERLAFMLADAKAELLLTHDGLRERWDSPGVAVIALDADWQLIADESDENPLCEFAGEALAYVIYTSGSTGRPKGVCVNHSSVVHLITECQTLFDFRPDDVWTVVHSYAFDFSVWEIFGALLNGCRLIIVPLLVTQAPADFHQLLRDRKVTILNQTPSAARQLHDSLAEPSQRDELSLRLFICGGEALPSSLAAELLEWNVPLWNFYGPTESTVWATLTQVRREQLAGPSASIGRAIRGLQTYILDNELRPLAAGAAGELYLGGPQLARGYLHQPDLTASRFVPNSFSTDAGTRLYRSGDLARYSPDGSIEHLGRLDHQVKVRGFRIELEEIEAAIMRHPLVREAVVTTSDDQSGEKRLLAYVVPRSHETAGDDATVLDDRRMAEWLDVWDETYKQPAPQDDPTFNIIGWNSSYTGLPYSAAEMKEWVEQTVARIRALNPRRVLEIGCGSGLLLFRLAPSCEYYVGADSSAAVQVYLQEQLSARGRQLSQVALSQRTADDFDGFEAESFDTVIINSVAQYFPRAQYLFRVLEGAARVTKSGGAIFIGDLRNLELLSAFHTSVQLSQAPNSLSLIDLRQRISRNILSDEQLAIDCSFFETLRLHLPRISEVEVQLKRGRRQNETTKFRYDVCLRIGARAALPDEQAQPLKLDWQTGGLGLLETRLFLLEQEAQGVTTPLLICNVPNARLSYEVKALELLAAASGTVSELRRQLRQTKFSGVDPEDWWRLGDELNLAVEVRPAVGKAECYEVIFGRRVAPSIALAGIETTPAAPPPLDWKRYANDPLQGAFTRRLAPQLRSFLRASLPEYMTPATFILLDALPLTANAKIDRAALPAPDSTRPELAEAFVAPRNQTEAKLAEVWASVLKLDRVGVDDNFMELGGHSVMATQISSRVRDVFGVELPLRTIFEAPTIASLAESITVERRANTSPTAGAGPRESLAGPDVQRVIARRRSSLDRAAPLSFAQQRLWFLDQLVPGTPVYNLPAGVRLGAIDRHLLEQSLNEIVRRHETLRTTIAAVGGQAHQVIAPALELALPFADLTRLPNMEREAETWRLSRQEAEALFDLARGPLLRTRLLQLGQDDFLLLVTMHHIISDNWSIVVFFEELAALYAAFSSGQPSPLGDLPIQYADYSAWQREQLSGDVLDAQLAFWQKQLAGAPTVLELPADGPRPRVVSLRGARQSLVLSKSLVRALRTFSQREGATTFMTLLAVFSLLLYRLTGQDDILIGSPIANRVRTETEGLIGLFLNNLVLRAKLSDQITFRDLLEQVRETALAAFANQDVPFEKLVEALQPQRDLSRTPLFQVFFNLFDSADNEIDFAGQKAEVFSPLEAWSQFDLTLYAAEKGEAIELLIAFNANLFRPDRMAEMLEQFRCLLDQIVVAPDKQIAQYSLLTTRSWHLLPDPASVIAEPEHDPISKVFFAKASETPEAQAICQGTASWSYQELAHQAETIAGALLSGGLQKGDVVAVTGPPSFGLIASMIAVLSSGGVLLTLDAGLPLERRRLMIKEARAVRTIQVGERRGEDESLTESPAAALSIVGENDGGLIGPDKANATAVQLPLLASDDPAYLFFTSGTTGVPRGVLGCHKGLSHFLAWQREEFKVTAADRAAQLTGLSFDVVLRDIFLPLTSGASLHLPDDPNEVTAGRILTWLERERISLLHTVPSLAQAWLNDLPAGGVTLGALRLVFFAGEPLTDTLVRRWRESISATGKLVNLYGPTETTLAKCFYVVPDEPALGVQPVGQPLPETQALVLNRNNVVCGIGEAGEIVIRTPFRTLGYINAEQEQQARFIRNPFTEVTQTGGLRADVESAPTGSWRYNEVSDLLYRTGDRGRFRPDGELEILGRLDDQIKVRGLRIEPAEVTAVLARHPSVQSCLVTPCLDTRGENALAAYVVMAADDLSVGELRSWLGKQLPAAMVPSYFVVLEALPLTPNGKIDRRALPEPDRSRPELQQEFVGPRNSIEEIVAGIWADVLGLDRVSVVRDFFELGGHSLLATQIISRVRDTCQTELPLSSVFEGRTVAGLSQMVLAARQAPEVNAPVIRALPRKRRRTLV